MNFRLPPRSEVGYLDAEIANEGEKVILSDGDSVNWSPPPVKPVIPDFSQIKSIRHYFGRTGHQTWPAWLYHPSEAPKIVKNAEEAHALGVRYRKATTDELNRYGVKAVWDYAEDSAWRSQPYETRFDPKNPGQGKTVIIGVPNPAIAQNELVRALIPEVAAAVAQALRGAGGSPAAPPSFDPKMWEEFQAFLTFKKSAEAVAALDSTEAPSGSALSGNALTQDEERKFWEDEAVRKGVKFDGRWSLAKLRAEVEKAA